MPGPTTPTTPTWSPPPAYPLIDVGRLNAQRQAQAARAASGFLVGAAFLHALAIPVSLLIFKALVESQAGRSLSWGELFDATSRAGVLWFLEIGVLVQADFAAIAGIGAFLLRGGRAKAAVPMIVVGVVALIFSIVVFGGIVGLIGGALSIAGGAKGRPRAAPVFIYSPYGSGLPPSPPPPPYRP